MSAINSGIPIQPAPTQPAALYKLLPGGGAFRADVGAIPPDPANKDWRDFLAWLAAGAGNTPAPADVATTALSDAGPTTLQKLIAVLVAKRIINATDVG